MKTDMWVGKNLRQCLDRQCSSSHERNNAKPRKIKVTVCGVRAVVPVLADRRPPEQYLGKKKVESTGSGQESMQLPHGHAHDLPGERIAGGVEMLLRM